MTFTTRCFERSHGRKPSPTANGTWAFQQTRTDVAFDADRFGEVKFRAGTLAEAKRQMRAEFGNTTTWAVMP